MRQRIFFSFVVVFVLFLCGCGKFLTAPINTEVDRGYRNTKGEYEIRNAEQLIWIAERIRFSETGRFPNDDKTVVKLMNDINLANKPFGGIAVGDNAILFNGTFDGGGFIIENMSINSPNGTNVGFIGKTSSTAVVRNIRFKNANVSGGSFFVAILVGFNDGIIERCGTGGGTADATADLGGLTGSTSVGAIAGYNGGTIRECYNRVNISGTSQRTGGIVGSNSKDGIIENTYNLGNVSYNNTIAASMGIAGNNIFGGKIRKCYSPLINNQRGEEDSFSNESDFNDKSKLESKGWDFTDVWEIRAGKTYLKHVK